MGSDSCKSLKNIYMESYFYDKLSVGKNSNLKVTFYLSKDFKR